MPTFEGTPGAATTPFGAYRTFLTGASSLYPEVLFSHTQPASFAWVQKSLGTSGYFTVASGRHSDSYSWLGYQSTSASYNWCFGASNMRRWSNFGLYTPGESYAAVVTAAAGFSSWDASKWMGYKARLASQPDTSDGAAEADAYLRIGSRQSSGAAHEPFQGALGNLALWNRALSFGEAKAYIENPWQLFRRDPARTHFFPAGGAGITLTVADATHAHSTDGIALSQANTLALADALHGHSADNLALIQQHVLAVLDALHAHSAEAPTLTQANTLAPAEALHGHLADNVTVSVAGTLAVAEATHGHSADQVNLVQAHMLAVAEALHGHAADNLTLSAGDTLAPAAATHGHTADNVALTQASVLVVQESAHGHTVESVTLSYGLTLAIADALHAHAADNVVLTQGYLLTVADATHAHAADAPALTQANVLVVSDALHAQLVDAISLQLPGMGGAPASRTIVVQAANRTIYVARSNRTITVH